MNFAQPLDAQTAATIFGALFALGIASVALVAWKSARRAKKGIARRNQGPETISLVELEENYRQIVEERAECAARLENKLSSLRTLHLESMSVQQIVSRSSIEERANLTAILGIRRGSSDERIETALRAAGSHSVAITLRKLRRREAHVAYAEVARDVVAKLGGVRPNIDIAANLAEQMAVEVAFKSVLEKLTPEERRALELKLSNAHGKSPKGVAAAGGALALAHLSGFGLYTAASSSLAAVAAAFHLTLPFAAYTSMSSTIAVLVGPMGWAALASVGLAKLVSTNYRKTVPAVLSIATIRIRLINERDVEIDKTLVERGTDVAKYDERLSSLRIVLQQATEAGLSEVNRDTVPI